MATLKSDKAIQEVDGNGSSFYSMADFGISGAGY
jgi:hypothetical protein